MGGIRGLQRSAEWRFFGALRSAGGPTTTLWWALVVGRGALPAVFAIAMGALVADVEAGRELARGLVLVGVVFVVMQSIGPLHDALSTTLGARLSHWLHEQLLDATLGPAGLAHLEDSSVADELASARDFDRGLTGPDLETSMPNVGGGFVAFVGGLAQVLVLFAYRWWAPLVLGAAWLSTHNLLKRGAVWHGRDDPDVREMQRKADYSYRLLVDAPGSKEVRLFGLAEWATEGFRKLRFEILDRSWEARRLAWRPTLVAVVVVVAGNAFFFWRLAADASAGRLGLDELVVFAQVAIGAQALAFGEWDWWFRTSAQPVPIVLDLAERMRSIGDLETSAGDAAPEAVGDVRLDGVRFSYPGTDVVVLDGVDLVVPAGSTLAIVGQNGAGKTTLAKLLCRLYDPTGGSITAGGRDLRTIDPAEWRTQVAAVFQDFVRYELDLRSNVAPGLEVADVVVERALATADGSGLADLDTIMSKAYDGGTDLSGGQWQRVAIARALAAVDSGAGLLLLDEPTAHLDVRAEKAVFDRVIDATRAVTTILISHRFATVRRADLIAVIEHGRVIESGSHDELMAHGGRYRTMFDLQAARFGDAPAGGAPLEVEA